MKNKLLLIFAALFIFTANIYANTNEDDVDYSGTYTGTVTVGLHKALETMIPGLQALIEQQLGGPIPSIPGVQVALTKQENEEYTISVPLDFGDIELPDYLDLGELKMENILGWTEGTRFILDQMNTEYTTGPVIPTPAELEDIFTQDFLYIYFQLENGAVNDKNELSLEINIMLKLKDKTGVDQYVPFIVVNFDKSNTGIKTYTDSSLEIYASPASNVITVIGSVNESYSIYNVNGALIQSGNMQNGQISISNIATGAYLVKVDNKIAKFIK